MCRSTWEPWPSHRTGTAFANGNKIHFFHDAGYLQASSLDTLPTAVLIYTAALVTTFLLRKDLRLGVTRSLAAEQSRAEQELEAASYRRNCPFLSRAVPSILTAGCMNGQSLSRRRQVHQQGCPRFQLEAQRWACPDLQDEEPHYLPKVMSIGG